MPETTQFSVGTDSAQDTTSLKANSVLQNRYKVTGVLGGGGMGTVYQARDLNFTDVKKMVAIKEMQTSTADTGTRISMLRTFRREANILATLSHPAIPKIFDSFDVNERAYLVMEYIDGSDLELILNKTKELPVEKIIDWAIELCDVLGYLHNQKPDPIVFRDMKPSNVMIDSLGRVRLIDFGIAKAFVVGVKGTMIGTEGYSAPEQYRGEAAPVSDVYGLGATLHQLLTHKDPRLEPPFTFNERPIPNYNPDAPPGLIAVIDRAVRTTPGERYESCAEMKEALERVKRPAYSGPLLLQPSANGGAAHVVDGQSPTGFFDDVVQETSGIQARWKFKSEDEIRSAPSAMREVAFVGSYDKNMWALKLDTGELVWKFATKGGIASSPVVDETNRLVIFGSEDNVVYAVDYRTGRPSWNYQTKDKIRSTPRLAHDHVFVGSDDGFIHALSAINGRKLWAFETGAPVRSRPYVTNDLIIAGTESGEVFAVSFSGQRKWSMRTRKNVIAGPYVNEQEGLCFIASQDGYLYALDVANGIASWRYRTGGALISSPVEAKGLVYVGSTDGHLYALNTLNGRERWKFNAGKPIVASPLVYRDAVYVGGTDSYLYCIGADNGKERWKFKTGAPITAAPFAIGDLLLVASMDHTLYALPIVS